MSLVTQYKQLVGEKELNPIIHNFSAILAASGWNNVRYHAPHYDDDVGFPTMALMKQGEGIMSYPVGVVKNCSREVFLKFWKHHKLFDSYKAYYENFTTHASELYRQLSYKNIASDKEEKTLQRLSEMRDRAWDLNALYFFSLYFDQELCQRFLDECGARYSKEEFRSMWEVASVAVEHSFENKRALLVLDLLDANRPWSEIAEVCQYFETSYDHVASIQDVKDLLQERFGIFERAIKRDRLRTELAEARAQRKERFDGMMHAMSPGLQKAALFTRNSIEFRDIRKDDLMKFVTVAFRYGELLFERASLDRELIFNYMFDEMLNGDEYLRKNRTDVLRRPDGFSMLVTKEGIVHKSYGDYDKLKQELTDFFNEQRFGATGVTNQVSGQVGCPGLASGVVRVISNFRQQKDLFKQGEILVTGMTRPEFVPLMKKAAAIVTDEGGVTCHAAIVSRELHIPCIIGTGNATQVYKDGDLVEVDAERGIVKKINQ